MGIVRGAKEYKKFKDGEKLTRKQAMVAMCYDCMGGVQEDCLGTDCPMYDYRPSKGR